ncbi:MAG: XrtA/PEP-CTERM system TPR-repeat protein PrsT [Pseudomonadota bacterium]
MRLILVPLILLLLAGCAGETAEQYLENARSHIDRGAYTEAAIELKNALRLDNQSAEARWLLAQVNLLTEEYLAAEKELQRAQTLGWPADEVTPTLARAWLAQGKLEDILGLSDEELSPFAASELLAVQSSAALMLNDTDRAGALAQKALTERPESVPAQLAQGSVMLQRGDANEALQIANTLLSAGTQTAPIHRLRGQALLQQQQWEEALEAYDLVIALSDLAVADRVTRALILIRLGNYDAAQADASELMERYPQHPAGNYIQGMLHFQNHKFREAVNALTTAEPMAARFPALLLFLSRAHLIEGSIGSATEAADSFVGLVPTDPDGRKLLATLHLQNGNYEAASDVIQPVLDGRPYDIPALTILARAMLLGGEVDRALVIYARIGALLPELPGAPPPLATGLIAPGVNAEAAKRLAAAVDDSPVFPQEDLFIILGHLRDKDYDAAVEAAESYRWRATGSIAPFHILGRVHLIAGHPQQARDSFEKALERQPGDPTANLSLAQLYLADGDTDRARTYYERVLRQDPTHLPTLLLMAALDARENNSWRMVRVLEQAIEAHPQALEPRASLARHYLDSGKPENVQPLFEDLSELQIASPVVLELTALAQLGQRQFKGAQSTLDDLIDSGAASAQHHYLVATAAYGAGQSEAVKPALLNALDQDPEHVLTLLNLANIARAEGEEEVFNGYLATLTQVAPDEPRVLLLRASEERRKGNYGNAANLSRRAFEVSPGTQSLLAMVSYLKAADQPKEALAAMRRWLRDHPQDSVTRLALATELQQSDDEKAAVNQYRTILKTSPNNVVALNNLAWLIRNKQRQQALVLIRKAAFSAPEAPEVLDTLAVIEHLNGNNENAYSAIQKAVSVAPQNPTMLYHQAMIEAAMGDEAQALSTLETVLSADQEDFPEQAEAQALLESLRG